MLVLGLETSMLPGSIALCRDGVCLEQRSLQPGRRHAETLVPELQRLLADHGYHLRDCRGIAVSQGPGSFTGLRVGVTCAKTLAYANGAELAAVSTLAAAAHNVGADVEHVFVISDAQRGEIFCAEFGRDAEGEWRQSDSVSIVNAQSWSDARRAHDVVTGPGLTKYEPLLGGRCRVLPPETWTPQAAVIAELGRRQFESGQTPDMWTLEPFYLRKSAAEERRDDGEKRQIT